MLSVTHRCSLDTEAQSSPEEGLLRSFFFFFLLLCCYDTTMIQLPDGMKSHIDLVSSEHEFKANLY